MSDPEGPARSHAGDLPGLSATELAAAVAHAANNIGALLVAATAFLDDGTRSPHADHAQAVLESSIARLHTLASALHLLALEPAQVALVQAGPPLVLGAPDLERLRHALGREPQLELGPCPVLVDLPSRVDRGTLQSLVACMVDCVRRQLPQARSARLTWSGTGAVPPDEALAAAPAWVFDVDDGACPPAALLQSRPGMAEHALAHAAVLLRPLGVQVEAGPGGHHRLRLAAPAPAAEGEA